LGYVSKAEDEVGLVHSGYKVITCDSNFISFASSYSLLGVVIPQGFPRIKEEIFKNIKDISSLVFPNIIHPSVIMKRDSIALGIGNVIAANVVMTLDIEIGDFNLINSSVTIGHDVRISNYCVINPLVSISGNVVLEDRVLVGTGASVLQNVVIGRDSAIGIGSAVIKNVPCDSTSLGVPALTHRSI